MFIFLKRKLDLMILWLFPEFPEESPEDMTTYREGTSAGNTVQDRIDIGELSFSSGNCFMWENKKVLGPPD